MAARCVRASAVDGVDGCCDGDARGVTATCRGTVQLYNRLVKRGKYTEDEARLVMQQLFSAVAYMHKLGIIHRDLKPENILLLSDDDDTTVKICGEARRAPIFVAAILH